MAITPEAWRKRLHDLEQKNLRRSLAVPTGIDFFSNDYLGLARSPELAKQIELAIQAFGQPSHGATGSRLLSGHSALADEVEAYLAKWLGAESTLFFGSGYGANLAVLSSLPQKGDTILYDQYAHACLKDGARLSPAQRFSFRHNDLDDLSRKAQRATGILYVVVESVYSMDGDQAPLAELVAWAEAHDAVLMVDEAHSTGIYGQAGAGLAVELGLADRIAIRVHTFGKAMGTHGAVVAGSETLRSLLLSTARPFIYTTAPPPHQLLAIREAVKYLQKQPQLAEELQATIQHFRTEVSRLKLPPSIHLLDSQSPIQGLVTPGAEAARDAARALQAAGFAVRPILSPTVPTGTERVRICLHRYNTPQEVSDLVHTFARLWANATL